MKYVSFDHTENVTKEAAGRRDCGNAITYHTRKENAVFTGKMQNDTSATKKDIWKSIKLCRPMGNIYRFEITAF